MTTPPSAQPRHAAFTAWLDDRVAQDGRSVLALERAAGLSDKTIGRVLRSPTARSSERLVRAIAVFFQDDPDEVGVLAGYPDRRVPAPDPRRFATLGEWLEAALQVRNESAGHASIGAGLNEGAVREILKGRGRDGFVERPVIDKLGAYFRVDAAALHALRRKNPARVAAGKARADQDPEAMRAWNAKGRAALKEQPLTPEQRSAIGRRAGAATARVLGADGWREIQAKGVATRKASGDWYKSDETRARFSERMQVATRESGPRAWRTRLSRLTQDERDRMAKVLRIARAIQRLLGPDVDPGYRERELPRARAQLAELRKDARPTFKKRSTFLQDLDIAEKAVRLKDGEKRSYHEVASLLFVEPPPLGEPRRDPTASEERRAAEAVRRGRLLRLGNLPDANTTRRIASKSPMRNAVYPIDTKHSA